MTPSSDLIRATERGRMEYPDVLSPVVQVVSSPVPRAKYRAGDLVSLCVEDSALGIKYDQAVILGVRRNCQVFIFPIFYAQLSIYNQFRNLPDMPEPVIDSDPISNTTLNPTSQPTPAAALAPATVLNVE